MQQPIDVSDKGFDSRAINAGRDPDCASMPIYMANVGKDFYSRHNNPTTTALQDCVKSLEGGAYAESAACGISAITQTFMTLLKQGDRLLTHKCVYDWVDTFVHHQAPRMGVHAGQVDMRDLDAVMPFGHVCQPEDVANVVRFFVSDQNSYLTGERVYCDGGGQS